MPQNLLNYSLTNLNKRPSGNCTRYRPPRREVMSTLVFVVPSSKDLPLKLRILNVPSTEDRISSS